MNLSNLKPPKGATKTKKRLGIGPGSGVGKTSGRGHKGQNSRSGGGVKPWFEGGQMPLQMRLPKVGFKSRRPANQVVNLKDLTRKGLKGSVTPDTLKEAGLIGSASLPAKILGVGEILEAVEISGIAVSKSAGEKISAAGGNVAAKGDEVGNGSPSGGQE
jgi:large subunit ribosomal protein L15